MANVSYKDVLNLAKVLRSLPEEQLTQITRLAKIMGEEELLTLHEKLQSVQEREVEAMQIGIDKMQKALSGVKKCRRAYIRHQGNEAHAEDMQDAEDYLSNQLEHGV